MESRILGEIRCHVSVDYEGLILPRLLLGSSTVCDWFADTIDPKSYDLSGSDKKDECIWKHASLKAKDKAVIVETIKIDEDSILIRAFCKTQVIEEQILPSIIEILKKYSPYRDFINDKSKHQIRYRTITTKVRFDNGLAKFISSDLVKMMDDEVAPKCEEIVTKTAKSFGFDEVSHIKEIHPFSLRFMISIYPEKVSDARQHREFEQIEVGIWAHGYTDYKENLYTVITDLPFKEHEFVLEKIAALLTNNI